MASADPRPTVTILYHFFHPDDVVSARHFDDLATGLAERGWRVIVRPSNRACRSGQACFAKRETWNGVEIERVWRPDWSQASNRGRLLNAMWMVKNWSRIGLFSRKFQREAMIVGTDPILSVLAVLPWRLRRPSATIAHWCFDLYPDAAVADGLLSADSWLNRVLTKLTAAAYRRCTFIADLGACMARRLDAAAPGVRTVTLTPWALVEPSEVPASDPAVRRELFGSAELGLLYSGTFGRAHTSSEFLSLARELRGESVGFCFAGRGNRMEELQAEVTAADVNIHFAGFAPEAELERRLTAADIHLVSLRPEWTGTVVPSKFFGALAAGRPVLFAGSPESAIAQWIRQHEVGWVLTQDNVAEVATLLRRLTHAPHELAELREHCHRVYHEHFSKRIVLDRWDQMLRNQLTIVEPVTNRRLEPALAT